MGGGEEGGEKLLGVSGGSPSNPLEGRPGDVSASKGLAAVASPQNSGGGSLVACHWQ